MVAAEGVEDLEQLRFLRAAGCQRAQGFPFKAAVTPGRALALAGAALEPPLRGPSVEPLAA